MRIVALLPNLHSIVIISSLNISYPPNNNNYSKIGLYSGWEEIRIEYGV